MSVCVPFGSFRCCEVLSVPFGGNVSVQTAGDTSRHYANAAYQVLACSPRLNFIYIDNLACANLNMPFDTPQDAAGACIVYFVVVELLKYWMKNRLVFQPSVAAKRRRMMPSKCLMQMTNFCRASTYSNSFTF